MRSLTFYWNRFTRVLPASHRVIREKTYSKNMKVLLVYPEHPLTFWSYKYALKYFGKQAAYPPLGLPTVAALLPPKRHKKLIDMNTETLSDEDLRWADYVF